jgi:hypothetical protein
MTSSKDWKKKVWIGYGNNEEEMRRSNNFNGAICLLFSKKKEFEYDKKYKVTLEEIK